MHAEFCVGRFGACYSKWAFSQTSRLQEVVDLSRETQELGWPKDEPTLAFFRERRFLLEPLIAQRYSECPLVVSSYGSRIWVLYLIHLGNSGTWCFLEEREYRINGRLDGLSSKRMVCRSESTAIDRTRTQRHIGAAQSAKSSGVSVKAGGVPGVRRSIGKSYGACRGHAVGWASIVA